MLQVSKEYSKQAQSRRQRCQQAPASLTSLRVTRETLCAPETGREHFGQLPMADVLQGIRSLRSLSCPVRTMADRASIRVAYSGGMEGCVQPAGW